MGEIGDSDGICHFIGVVVEVLLRFLVGITTDNMDDSISFNLTPRRSRAGLDIFNLLVGPIEVRVHS